MAASDIIYPEAQELIRIASEKQQVITANRPIFDLFPVVTQDVAVLRWEQADRYAGLQKVRGLGGLPSRVKPTGLRAFEMRPGTYGEFSLLEEEELTIRRAPGTLTNPIDLTDLVLERQDHLLVRRYDRIEKILWDLASTGTFAVLSEDGAILHTDSFPIRQYTPTTPWSDHANSAPMRDLQAAKLLAFGYSVDFGNPGRLYINEVTWSEVRQNTNVADFFGRRTSGLSTINNLEELNKILAGDNLPQIVIYDGSYLEESGIPGVDGVPTRFIPDGKGILVGKRPAGQAIGQYRFTRNANNPGFAAGPYTVVVDSMTTGTTPVPRQIQVHDGHNGGPVIFFPSAIVVLNLY